MPSSSNPLRRCPVSGFLLVLIVILLPLPPVLLVSTLLAGAPAWHTVGVGIFVAAIYALVWLWYRPTRFEIDREALRIIWPLRTRILPRTDIVRARIVDRKEFRTEFGIGMRMGAGGLWGGFGLLWTSRRGIIDFYISRTDRFVIVERRSGRSLMITPERPEQFVAALEARAG
jgi:hypothetical protein